ncbi:hypothetical protein ABZW50_23045 [Streptomyces bacillaris]
MSIGRRRFAVSSLVLGLAFALGGCSAAGTTAVDTAGLPGVWTGSGGGRVDFHADGRFSMKGIPAESIGFAFGEPPDEDRVAGSGTWEQDTDEDRLNLMIDAGGSFTDAKQMAVLMVAEDGPPQVLFFSTNVDKPYGYEIRKNS